MGIGVCFFTEGVGAGPRKHMDILGLSMNDGADLRAPMATVATWSTHSAVLRTDNAGRRVLFELVSPGYFSTLGLEPVDGRLMSTADAADQGAPAAVVSLALSRALFKSSHDAVGARALLGGTEVVIVGVVPSTFRGVSGASDVWLPDSNRPIATTGAAGAPRQRGVGENSVHEGAILHGARRSGRALEGIVSDLRPQML